MATGVATEYDLTVGKKLWVENFVYILTPTDVPLQGSFNGTSSAVPGSPKSVLPNDTCEQIKVEWPEEVLLTPRTVLSATAVTADTFITVAVGERERFQPGDIIRINDEEVRVTAYGTTADTLVTSRAVASSTAAQHANASDVIGVGSALPEGSDPPAARIRDRTKEFNLTEIFGPHKIHISGTKMVTSQYGVPSEWDHQSSNRMKEMHVAYEQAILYGRRFEDTTQGNEWRGMGGLSYYIATNVDAATTDLTEAKLIDQMQASYNNGGSIDLAITPPAQKRKISLYQQASVRYAYQDRIRGSVVDVYESDFGVVDICMTRHARSKDVWLVDKQFVELQTLTERGAQLEVLSKTGDSMQGQALMERSLKVRLEKRHARFSALT